MKTLIAILISNFIFMGGCIVERDVQDNGYGPPPWAPTFTFGAVYYYFPDWEIYYYVPTARWIYYDGGTWIFAAALPVWCAHIDLFSSYKVTLNYRGDKPYIYHNTYVVKYPARHIYAEKRSPYSSNAKSISQNKNKKSGGREWFKSNDPPKKNIQQQKRAPEKNLNKPTQEPKNQPSHNRESNKGGGRGKNK